MVYAMRSITLRWKGSDALAVVRPTGDYLLDFFCPDSVLCTAESLSLLCLILYLDLYVLGDDAWIR